MPARAVGCMLAILGGHRNRTHHQERRQRTQVEGHVQYHPHKGPSAIHLATQDQKHTTPNLETWNTLWPHLGALDPRGSGKSEHDHSFSQSCVPTVPCSQGASQKELGRPVSRPYYLDTWQHPTSRGSRFPHNLPSQFRGTDMS